jgi:hypothetical protein
MTERTPPAMVSVYGGDDGKTCLGFILTRHHDFEAFDADEKSLGRFPTMTAAADAVSEARAK